MKCNAAFTWTALNSYFRIFFASLGSFKYYMKPENSFLSCRLFQIEFNYQSVDSTPYSTFTPALCKLLNFNHISIIDTAFPS